MAKPHRPPEWQLPSGVSAGLWDYMHSSQLVEGYDAHVATSPLFAWDQRFVAEHLTPPGHVLDLGCGTARHLLQLARRGFEVVGVDLSSAMLDQAAVKLRADALPVTLVQANLVELDAIRSNAFDACLCLFATLGMIHGAAERARVLAQACRVLRPGGRLLLHVHNRWFNFWTAQRGWLILDTLRGLLGRPTGDLTMPIHQGVAGLTMHLFTKRELRRSLHRAGFGAVQCEPIALNTTGKLRAPWWFGRLRAMGYFVVAQKPHA